MRFCIFLRTPRSEADVSHQILTVQLSLLSSSHRLCSHEITSLSVNLKAGSVCEAIIPHRQRNQSRSSKLINNYEYIFVWLLTRLIGVHGASQYVVYEREQVAIIALPENKRLKLKSVGDDVIMKNPNSAKNSRVIVTVILRDFPLYFPAMRRLEQTHFLPVNPITHVLARIPSPHTHTNTQTHSKTKNTVQ